MLPEISIMPFEFLRPIWLLGLIVVIVLSLLRYKKNSSSNQQSLIAPHLSGNIVSKGAQNGKRQFTFSLMAAIACIALAGPTWRSIDMPVYEMEKAQVIAFDLSYSMFATDIKPNRLSQARFKAIDLVKHWSEGEKALIAYAGDAFTVTPLTRDGNAIINHIPSLSPDIMPVRGSRADLALDKAIELLQNAGYNQGHIVFISDNIAPQQSQQMIDKLKGTNWVVSVLAVATEQGAPIQLSDGSLLKSDNGEIIVPKLDAKPLYDLSRAGEGLYLTSRTNSSDIEQLGSFFDDQQTRKNESEQAGADQFAIDDGYWMSFLLLPLFLLLFRKGTFFALLLVISIPFTSPTLEASESSIWNNDQQNGYKAYQSEDYQSASEFYTTPLEQGSALYKDKQYEQALSAFTEAVSQQPENASAFYNQGNSYAQLQQLDKAIEAYDKALTIDPNLQQAQQNKTLLEQLKEQQEQEQQDQKNDQSNEQDSQQDQQQSEDQQSQESDSEQKSDDQQSQDSESEQQQSEDQQSQESESEQQQSEDQQSQESESEQQQSEEQQAQAESQSEPIEDQSTEQQAAQLTETDQAVNQELEELPNWLKNMPDDPSILLRRKMQVEYQKRAKSQPVQQQPSNGAIW
ncbi:hypothetical protein GCM10007916_07950 [Psychromonas marina]|uniref:VWFA domain-containing protein n=1 Tax=Psychromonas marina TaxID=88364 RepID=A0ABQ6DXY8_9GAMM|nr:tetratricopeptide repeat protein [Psychromonas marina]GLS89728.1 hypothetical protein GCM10007916_07950 [Psychromonas marina]